LLSFIFIFIFITIISILIIMIMVVCRSCYAQRPRMLRKRSHQAFTDMEVEQPLSPVLRPPHQEMGSGDSESDGDEVMGTGDTSTLVHQTEAQPACALHIHPLIHMQGDTTQQDTATSLSHHML